MKNRENFINWIEKDHPVTNSLRFISGWDFENSQNREQCIRRIISENGEVDYSSLNYAERKLLMPSKIFFNYAIRISLYIAAFYLVVIAYMSFSKYPSISLFLFLFGSYFIFWFHRGFYPIYKQHTETVNKVKNKLFTEYISKLFESSIGSIYKKIENTEDEIKRYVLESISESQQDKKRKNYNQAKKVLLLNFLKYDSNAEDDSIDLSKKIDNKKLFQFAAEAKCKEETISQNQKFFKDRKTFLKQTKKQLIDCKTFFKDYEQLEIYKTNRSFRSSMNSLLHEIEERTK